MDYQMFKEQLAALLKRKAGDDFEVKVESVQKLNGIEKEAFVISRKKDWIAPTIYVELLYECCLQGVPLSQIAEKVLEQYRKVEAEARRPEKAAFFTNWKNAAPQIYCELIHAEKNRTLQNELSMRTSSYIMELDLKELSRWYGKKRTFQPISKFQEEKRDLAFVMDKNISCGDVENCIREANKYVKEIRLFDVYEGGQIPEGKKSMAFTVTFAPKEEAFDFEKVQKFVEKICKKLQNEFNIELRG